MLLKAVDLSWNYVAHEQVARELESQLNLMPTRGAFTGRKKGKNGKFTDARPIALSDRKEDQQAKRTAIPVASVIADLCRVWEMVTDPTSAPMVQGCGQKFVEQLRLAGYRLARGDKRDVVVVDWMGGTHNPAKRLGLKAAEFRKAIDDLDMARLPTVDAVRAQITTAVAHESDMHGSNDPATPLKTGIRETPERSLDHPADGPR